MIMNKLRKKTLGLLIMVFGVGTFISCLNENWQYYYSQDMMCNVPKFYDEKRGTHEGELFWLKKDSTLDTVSVFIEIEMGGYADKTIEFKGIPLKNYLRHLDKGLLDKIPSDMLEKKINLKYKYELWGWVNKIDGDSIGPNFSKSLFTQVQEEQDEFIDSIYSEDKSQKIKYCFMAYTGFVELTWIKLWMKELEINDSVIRQPEYQVTAKMKGYIK